MDFKICEDVSALGIHVVFLVIYDIDNTNYDVDLENTIYKFYKEFYTYYSSEDLEKDKNIIGYRELHKNIGINDKSLIASPESLIKILFKHKTLRPINFIVDTYNYVAIKNRISIGAHDIKHIYGDVRLCFTNGDEHFVPLGKKIPQVINKGEYCYIDDANEILCRLDCRQCDKTKTTVDTNSFLFIIQGNENISTITLESTAKELQTLIKSHSTKDSEDILKII